MDISSSLVEPHPPSPSPLPLRRVAKCRARQRARPRGAKGLDAPERRRPTQKRGEAPAASRSLSEWASCPAFDTLLGETDDVQRDAGLPQFLGEVLLDARSFADHRFDRLQVQDAVVADEGGAVALAAIEAELDDLDAARCGPGVRHGIATLGLRGGRQDHFRDARLDAVEPLPQKLAILPGLTAGERDDRTLRGELLATLPGAGGEIVAGVDHRGVERARHPAATHRREGLAGLDAVHFGGMVAHALHRLAAPLQRLAEELGVLQLGRVDLRRVIGTGEFAELLGGVVLAAFDALGDDVEAVGETPDEVGRKRLHTRVAQHVEHGLHHHLDGGSHLLRIGHVERFRRIDDAELRHLAMLDERAFISLGQILVHTRCRDVAGKIGEVVERSHKCLRTSRSLIRDWMKDEVSSDEPAGFCQGRGACPRAAQRGVGEPIFLGPERSEAKVAVP
uniref:Uncharacterized protein n=1 Tax=Rhizorhabdus wittichii (strain DC-6 / KACC 16600) TaxID=1283312 RepID=A0A059WBF0_RHIWD|nr:hypothetical protein [Rhizorhabdus wittichii DC-6]